MFGLFQRFTTINGYFKSQAIFRSCQAGLTSIIVTLFLQVLGNLFAFRFVWETTVYTQEFYVEWKENHFSGFAFGQAVSNVLISSKIIFPSSKTIMVYSYSVNWRSRLSFRAVSCNTYYARFSLDFMGEFACYW